MPPLKPLAHLVVGMLALGACTHVEPARPHQARPSAVIGVQPPPARRPIPAEWVYWEPPELDLHASGTAPTLPLADEMVQRLDGAATRWASLPESARESIRARGFAIVPGDGRTMGAFYRELADERVPLLFTMDALTWLAHAAFSRALAEAEDRELAPALGTMLVKLDARLGAEERGAHSDLIGAYALAHGVVAVARALADAAYVPPPELAALVDLERQRIVAHAGAGLSAILGAPIDYASLAPRGAVEERDARAGLHRAVAWLAHAPFVLVARTEAGDARVNVGQARTHARAALLLARLFDVGIDKDIARAWATIARVGEFVGGPPDDLAPVKVAQIASTVGLDVRNLAAIEDVVLVDKMRRAAAKAHATRLYDGAGGIAPLVAPSVDGGAPRPLDERWAFPRTALAMRIVGARASADSEVLQALVWPAVGAAPRVDDAGPIRRRALPSGLDVAAWLGSPEAREILRETRGDAFDGYDVALERLVARRPKEDAPERHASLHVSWLDVIATYLAPSSADAGQPYAATGAWRRRKIEVALDLWTILRHDEIPFARRSLGAEDPRVVAAGEARGFVEAHPEAIGKLLALVRQTASGLSKLAGAPKETPARGVLNEVEAILAGCLRVSLREANDEPLGADDVALIASLPARLEALDARLARSGESEVPIVIDVHEDLEGARVLQQATGTIDDLYVVTREPRSDKLTLAVGAAVPHYEFAQPAALRLSDEGWRARLRAGSAPPRYAFTAAYMVEPAR